MAIKEKKITDLEELQGIENDALLYVIQGGEDKKITAEKFLKEVNKGVGQLSNQIADQGKKIADLKESGVAVSYDPETKTLNISSGGAISENPEIGEVEKLIFNGQEIDLSKKLNKDDIAIGMHTDGLLYLFIDGAVSGSGVALPSGGTDGDVVGYVDSDKSIVLSGSLPEDVYMIKYEMDDGSVIDIGTLNLATINYADPNSADWKENYRLSSTGGVKECEGMVTTNYIPAKTGDVLRVKGLNLTVAKTDNCIVSMLNASKTQVARAATSAKKEHSLEGAKEVVHVENDICTYTILLLGDETQAGVSTGQYIRMCGSLMEGYTSKDVVITINEPI